VAANVSGGVIPHTPIWQMATACSSSFRTVFIIYDITMKACVKLITQIKCDNQKNQENVNDTTVTS
jgi:hypothetical protein